MSASDVTRRGIEGRRPDSEARMWQGGGRQGGGRHRRGEQLMVPKAEFASYYGRPIVKKPVWKELDIAGYLFTGGVAAGSAGLRGGARPQGPPAPPRGARAGPLSPGGGVPAPLAAGPRGPG